MSVTPTVPTGTTDATGRIQFRGDRFDAAMARLGHTREIDRARAAGVTKMTLWRWRKSAGLPSTPICAHRVAAAVGLTVDQLFVRVA